MGYIHAELMAQYAEDAKQHGKPWELWEHGENGTWTNCTWHPGWHTDILYRRKPRTIKIGDIGVPEPCKVALEYGQGYFVPDVATEGAILHAWNGDPEDVHALESKPVHLDRRSAVRHALALIEVSKGWWK